MHDYSLSREDLALVPVKNHGNGANNPHAQFQKLITLEKLIERQEKAERKAAK